MIGVYEIVNTVDGSVYVGSSINVQLRFYQHRRALRMGNHHNILLQQAWDKEGEKAFEFCILQAIAMQNLGNVDLDGIEQDYITSYSSEGKCYNIKGNSLLKEIFTKRKNLFARAGTHGNPMRKEIIMKRKKLFTQAGPRGNPVTANVYLSGVLPDERLTPRMARRAARITFGHENRVTIFDNQAGYGYRIYLNSARKLYRDNDNDTSIGRERG